MQTHRYIKASEKGKMLCYFQHVQPLRGTKELIDFLGNSHLSSTKAGGARRFLQRGTANTGERVGSLNSGLPSLAGTLPQRAFASPSLPSGARGGGGGWDG